jgi:glycosyltransferase involved in cell wall biosynthesis
MHQPVTPIMPESRVVSTGANERRQPRILYIVTRAEHGGAQTHVFRLAASMRQIFEVAVATGEEGYLTKACRDADIPVHVVPHLQREIRPIADVRAFCNLYVLVRSLRPDLIHTHTFKAGFLGRLVACLLKVSSVYTLHSWLFGTAAMPRAWSALAGPCERLAASWCQGLITLSDGGADLLHKYRIHSDSNVVIIRNGIPDCRERGRGNMPVATVIMVARFTKVKEHDILLRAFAKIRRGPHLLLVGDGPTRPACEKLASELGITDRVEFLGSRDDVASLLASAQLFVLASKYEMCPVSILEAMRAGLPIVASDVGGASEAIEDGKSGLLVPSGCVDRLAEALTLLVDDADLRTRLGSAARMRFEQRYLFEQQMALTSAFYKNVLSRSQPLAVGAGSNSPCPSRPAAELRTARDLQA